MHYLHQKEGEKKICYNDRTACKNQGKYRIRSAQNVYQQHLCTTDKS